MLSETCAPATATATAETCDVWWMPVGVWIRRECYGAGQPEGRGCRRTFRALDPDCAPVSA